ncbi:MAG TPA: zinc ribbon domain-containing protein [Verrucomicrobiae bacterium]|nr:zinc ribbon domain-containing protein [Verrucomicrobiae bacterium]
MPFYDYVCGDCGEFSLSRSIAGRDLPADCPECGASSARVVSAPNLSLMPAGRRQAFARNEKSQHEPGVKTRHHCGSGCGCGSKKTGAAKSTRTVDLGKVGRFETSRKPKRPWMLGH